MRYQDPNTPLRHEHETNASSIGMFCRSMRVLSTSLIGMIRHSMHASIAQISNTQNLCLQRFALFPFHMFVTKMLNPCAIIIHIV